MFEINHLYIYPIKSVGGISLPAINIVPSGFENDRLWMIVDNEGKFITQREFPKLNLVTAEWIDEKFIFKADNINDNLFLDPKSTLTEQMQVDIWNTTVSAFVESKEKNEWISDYLSIDVKIVRMPDRGRIKHTPLYSKPMYAQFSDGYPIHVVNLSSIKDLSKKTKTDLSHLRFRPNIVIDFEKEYIEDTIKELRSNQLVFECVKPCGRCVMITIAPGEDTIQKEPLKTLNEYRKVGHSVNFGFYVNPILQEGHSIKPRLRVRDPVTIV